MGARWNRLSKLVNLEHQGSGDTFRFFNAIPVSYGVLVKTGGLIATIGVRLLFRCGWYVEAFQHQCNVKINNIVFLVYICNRNQRTYDFNIHTTMVKNSNASPT